MGHERGHLGPYPIRRGNKHQIGGIGQVAELLSHLFFMSGLVQGMWRQQLARSQGAITQRAGAHIPGISGISSLEKRPLCASAHRT